VDYTSFSLSRYAQLIDRLMRSPRLIILGGVCVALAMCSVCTFILFESSVDAYERGKDSAHNTLTLIERDISRNFELYALSLQAVVDTFDDPEVLGLPVGLQREVLFDRAASAKYLGSMMLVDAQGHVRIDALGEATPELSLTDKAFFTVQRDRTDVGLYVSTPLDAHLNPGADLIVLSRRLSHADGSFAGIVFIAVKLQYFRDLFAGLSLGEQSQIALLDPNGTLLAREPSRSGDIGHSLRNTQNLAHLLSAASGSFDGVGSDKVVRLYEFGHVGELPLIVSVGTAHDAIYRTWRRRALWIGSLIGVFACSFVGLSVLFVRQIKYRMRAENALRTLASTDDLTGLSNRRMLEELLTSEVRYARRSGNALSVIFADIDRFKAYNDTYGHAAGDEVLAAVALCLAQAAQRPRDAATRYGGEEFVILLPETQAHVARLIAQRMLDAVNRLNLEHRGSELGHVTISLGVATWHGGPLTDGHALIEAADNAVYAAKAGGRNRIVVWQQASPAAPEPALRHEARG
jgi:diguanylate cyclase (GGDEF)-like protein